MILLLINSNNYNYDYLQLILTKIQQIGKTVMVFQYNGTLIF